MNKKIYFDNAATTPIIDSVKRTIFNALNYYGNPSSVHNEGRSVKEKIEIVRSKFLNTIHGNDGNAIFTSGGSEANNLAIIGTIDYLKSINKTTIITSSIEHPSVLNACKEAERRGFKIIYMPVMKDGRVDIEELDKIINENKDNVGLISIQWANSEIGAVQCIRDIGDLCEEYEILFHTDAVQAIGHYSIDVTANHIDMLSVSGHKINAPKGIGALYVKDKNILSPIIFGGGQEYGIRSGTENTIGILAFGTSLDDLYVDFEKKQKYINELRHTMINLLKDKMRIPYFINCCDGSNNIISLTIPKVEGNALMLMLNNKGVYVSTGSACSVNKLEASYIMKAIGIDDNDAVCTIRISLSYLNTIDEIEYSTTIISELSKDLFQISDNK